MQKKTSRLLVAFILTITSIISVKGQEIAIKTNLLYDMTTTLNAGFEFGINDKFTIDASVNYNPWSFSKNKKIKHLMIQPEIRYWLNEKLKGHFVGAHLLGGEYNVGNIDIPIDFLGTNFKELKECRYEGWFIGAGVVYGYSWALSSRWSMEANIGIGYIGAEYDKYDCEECGIWKDDGFKNYIGLTKASVSIVYIIK